MTVPDRGRRPLLSFSSLTAHRKCPQAWAYANVARLEKNRAYEVPYALEFGSMWHALRAVDSIERGAAKGSLLALPDKITTGDLGPVFTLEADSSPQGTWYYEHPTLGAFRKSQAFLGAMQKWFESLPPMTQEGWIADRGMDPIQLLHDMDARWRLRWENEDESPLLVEVDVVREIEGVGIICRIDEVFIDVKRNMVVVRDHKSGANVETVVAKDLMDSQLHLYAWAVAPLLREHGIPQPRAVAYDRARTATPKEPQVTKSGSLSKSVTDYDLVTYQQWADARQEYPGLKKDGSGAGVYVIEPEVEERLRSIEVLEKWNTRSNTPLNLNVVKVHLQAALDTYADQQRTRSRYKERGHAPRNLAEQVCKWCDFQQLCRAQMMGGTGEGQTYDPSDYGLRPRQKRSFSEPTDTTVMAG